MICPQCRSRATGKVGHNQYYCWDCNVEFVPTAEGYKVYCLLADGSLVPAAAETEKPKSQKGVVAG